MKKGIFKRIFTILLIINSISSVFAIGAFAMSDAEYTADTIAYKNGNTTEKSIEELRDDVKVSSRFYELFFGKKKKDKSERYLCVSGEAFGIKLQEPYVTVSEAKEGSALRRGDRILSIENVKTESIENIKEALKA